MSTPSRRPPESESTGPTLASIIQRAIPVTARGTFSAIVALAGAAAVLVGLILFLFVQELRGASYTVLALGGALLLISMIVSFGVVRQTIIGRKGRYGANTTIMIVAFVILGILVFVLGTRTAIRVDVTATRQFSLAPQTIDILKNLAEPVDAIAFFVPGNTQQEQYRIPVQNLLKEFEHRSGGKFTSQFVDPDRQPTLANRYRVTEYPTIVFEGKESGIQQGLTAPFFEERDISSAFLIVTGVQQKRLYYLTGHGELDMQSNVTDSKEAFGLATSGLFGDNYDVSSLSLVQNPEIRADAAAVIVAGPSRDLNDQEFQILHDYLKKGGRLLMLLEPATTPRKPEEPDPIQRFKQLLAQWALTVEDGIVIDLGSSLAGQPQTPLIQRPQYNTQEPVGAITALVEQSYFPGTASLKPSFPKEEMPRTIGQYPVAATTILSCLTQDVQVNTCPGGDFGARTPVVALEGVAPINETPDPTAAYQTKMVVFGDRDFATNFHINSVGNRDLLLNSVNWLTEDYALASVRPKQVGQFRRLVVTGSQMQLIRALGWFVLPVAMALLATIAWWRRR